MKCRYYLYYESHINKTLNVDQLCADQDVKEANVIRIWTKALE